MTIRRSTVDRSTAGQYARSLLAAPVDAGAFDVFRYDEATIADIHAAFKAKTLTCRALVQMYLDRIEAYDKKGPALNAIVVTNPDALKIADALDARFAQSGPVGPLHCVPLIVKDNYETTDMPTSAGSLSLKGVMSKTDAFQIKKLREAGALMLAKSNMAEFAFDPMETVNSLLPGYTRNPYALDRVTAGSSGGTAAAVAANFGAVGLGTDTGNSIRGPSSHTSLVGIRSTMGLTSRDGIVPLFLDKDIGGPMARTVADAVAIFDVIAGHDPADPVTAASQGKRADSYVEVPRQGRRARHAARRRATALHPAEHRSRRDEAHGAGARRPATAGRARSWTPSPSPRSTASRRGCCSASGSSPTSTTTCRGSRPTRR